MNNNKKMAAMILIAVLICVVGFLGGMHYQKGKIPQRGQAAISGNFGDRPENRPGMYDQENNKRGMLGNSNGQDARPMVGSIIAADDKSITVQMQDGSSKIVLFSASMSVNKAAEAATADLKVGETVRVFGSTNSDGSVSAQNIQLNPDMQGQPGQQQPQK